MLLTATAYAVVLSADEQYMLNLLNKERRANGLNALEIEPKLEFMARRYSQEMITYDFFSHTSPISGELLDRVNNAGVTGGWLLAGENLAGAPTVEAAFKGLMNSPTHKENMLEAKYTHVGIGEVDGGPYGKMFVQEFVAYPKKMFFASDNTNYDLLIYVNGNLLYSNPPAFIRQGRTLVPLKELFELLNVNAKWYNENESIIIEYPGGNIGLSISDNVAFINGEEVSIDQAPVLIKDKVFIPLRFVVENLQADVKWDSTLRTIEVTL